MPFGLTNAPASFQSLANDTLREFLDIFVVVYLDDILVFSETEAEHIEHVQKVLSKLRDASLYVKLKKCEFHVQSTEFLGFVISTKGISMDKKKVEAVASWPAPTTVKELMGFLGFTNFYRRFLPNYSKLTVPSTSLL